MILSYVVCYLFILIFYDIVGRKPIGEVEDGTMDFTENIQRPSETRVVITPDNHANRQDASGADDGLRCRRRPSSCVFEVQCET